MPTCLTPDKRRFATIEAATTYARYNQLGIGRLLAPYDCDCGWFHLTSQERISARAEADPAAVNELRHLPATAFADAVEADTTGRLPMPSRIALRDPRLYGRWTRTLRDLATNLDERMATAPPGSQWARRAAVYRHTLDARLAEATGLREKRRAVRAA